MLFLGRWKKLIDRSILIFVLVLVWGVVLRALFLGTTPFGFDQVQIITNAQKIVSGHLTLLGPRTGPAEMFIGPLTYYFAALFVPWFKPELVTVVAAIVWSLITGIVLIYLGKKYTDQSLTLNLLILWAFSPFMLLLDRVPWNPNTTFLAAALVFFPLLKKRELELSDVILMCVGLFVGYQSHFSGLLLFVIAGAGLIYRKNYRYLLWLFLSLIISLLPTVIFDLRHDWLNWRGFSGLMMNKDKVATYLILTRLWQKILIVVETTGKVFIVDTKFYIQFLIGGLIWLATLLRLGRQYHTTGLHTDSVISLIFTSILILFFALYRTSTPEYYFLILLPTLLWIVAKTIGHFNFNRPLLLIIVCGSYATWFVYSQSQQNIDLNLNNQVNIIHQLVDLSHQYPLTEVVYDMPAVDSLGLSYLITQYPPRLVNQGYKIHLVYPTTPDQTLIQKSGPIGLWLDPRIDSTKKYITLAQAIVGLPQGWQISQRLYPDAIQPDYQAYNLVDANNQNLAELRIYPWSILFEQIADQNNNLDFSTLPDGRWVLVNSMTRPAFLLKQAELGALLFTADDGLAKGVELLKK